MIAIAVVVLMSTVQIEARFGEPTSSLAGFDMPIKAGVFAIAKARHSVLPNGEVMLFVPGGSGPQLDRALANGPVSHVRVRALPRGLAIVLTPGAKMSADDVRFVDGHLKIDAVKVIAPTATEIKTEVRNPMSDIRRPTSEIRNPKSEIRATEQPQTDESRTEKPHSTKPLGTAPESSASPLRTFFTLTVLVAACAAAIVFSKRRKLQKLGADLDGIEVVSVKALGSKQRLAVVEVSGERLLIAASDQGLQLLSKLGDASARRETQTRPPTQAQSLADFASALEDAQNNQPIELTHPKPKARRSTDVAGLIKLRAASAWTLSEGGELT